MSTVSDRGDTDLQELSLLHGEAFILERLNFIVELQSDNMLHGHREENFWPRDTLYLFSVWSYHRVLDLWSEPRANVVRAVDIDHDHVHILL